jgi:hypothetical protein
MKNVFRMTVYYSKERIFPIYNEKNYKYMKGESN